MEQTEKRLFIAIDLTDDLLRDLSESKAKLEVYVKGRWVNRDNLHLTLKFLGKCGPEKTAEVISGLDTIAMENGTFTLETEAFGSFPSPKRARILWYGLSSNESLTLLWKSIDESMAKLGFPADSRSFQPHITLARYKTPGKPDIDRINREVVIEREILVNYFSLYESRLSSRGALYYCIKKFKLLA